MSKHPTVSEKKPPRGQPGIRYTVAMPTPTTHNFEVTVDLTRVSEAHVDLAIPAWTPGSYKIREFARGVSKFIASSGKKALKVERLDKDTWRVYLGNARSAQVTYEYYAFEFSVRTPHLDDSHGFFQPTNILPYVVGHLDAPATLVVKPYKDWQVACPLPKVRGKKNTYYAPNYDILADSPVEIGTHSTLSFEVDGKFHEIAIYGWGNYDEKQLVRDFKKIVVASRKMFGPLPYKNYLFILQITPNSGGGLEHLNSQVSAFPSFEYQDRDRYERFLSLISHEFFHLWNVKRLRPAPLGPFTYNQHAYTDALWVCEGLTSYYQWLILLKAGLINRERTLKALAKNIDNWDGRPGNDVMTLKESSLLAWTKLYLADENFPNTAISYYLKGALVGNLLDLEIRKRTKDKKSLDDVMKAGIERYGYPKPGFPDGGFEAMVTEIAGGDWKTWFKKHLDTTKKLDFTSAFADFGIELTREKVEKTDNEGNKHAQTYKPWLGASYKEENNALTITNVFVNSPASVGGVSAKDVLIAVDGIRVQTTARLEALLERAGIGAKIKLSLFRDDRLVNCKISVGKKESGAFELKVREKATKAQLKRLEAWLGKA